MINGAICNPFPFGHFIDLVDFSIGIDTIGFPIIEYRNGHFSVAESFIAAAVRGKNVLITVFNVGSFIEAFY
ncbi:hypothetical protein V4P56_00350 [Bartonella sp. B35(2025)]